MLLYIFLCIKLRLSKEKDNHLVKKILKCMVSKMFREIFLCINLDIYLLLRGDSRVSTQVGRIFFTFYYFMYLLYKCIYYATN